MIHKYDCPSCGIELHVPITKVQDEFIVKPTFSFKCGDCGQDLEEDRIINDYLYWNTEDWNTEEGKEV